MKKYRLIAFISAALLCVSAVSGCDGAKSGEETTSETTETGFIPMTIDGTDISEFEIVCSSSVPAAETAVSELRKYLKIETGVELAVKTESDAEHQLLIVFGEDEDGEGFSVKSGEGDLIISGDGPRGTLYGVYDFLETCAGWRFLTSDTDYLLPAEKVEIADVDYSDAPGFGYRDVYWSCYFDPSVSVKRKINARNIGEEYGGGLYFLGSSCHTLSTLTGLTDKDVICLTDPDIYETVLKNVMALLDANPGTKLISVSQNDAAGYCDCEECQKVYLEEGSRSGTVIRFVNKIADAVAEKYPDVTIHTFAYRYSRKPPKLTVPRPNVQVQLCSIECCFNHPLDDPDCAENASFVEDLKGWAAICDNLSIWDYTTDYSYYLAPFPDFDVLAENVRLFAESNVTSVFEEGMYVGESGEFAELRSYLLSKLLWDPDMTEDEYYAAMDDFLRGYYGEGWENIRAFIDLITESGDKLGDFGIYSKPFEMVKNRDIYNAIETLDAGFDEAEALAGDEKTLTHVKKTRLCYTFLKLIIEFDDRYYGADEAAKAECVAECQELYDALGEYGIRYSEGCPTLTMDGIERSPLYWY